MREKTLLFGALAATTIAAAFGVYKARERLPKAEIAPVSRLDSARVVRAEGIPIQLTGSDGTGLRLVSLKASAAIEDPLALTELHLTFENPEDRVLEGNFRIALPQGASLSRFAMKVGGVWQEGEVVEKKRAREVYEDFLHRNQDPALMEQSGGNEFTARVFPIPARGTKEIIVAYSEVLEAGAAYVLPLKGLPPLSSLDIDVHAAGGSAKDAVFGVHQQGDALHRQDAPPEDFIVDARVLPRSDGLRNGAIVLARVVPFATSRPDPITSAVVLVDTSASRVLGLGEQARLVQRVLANLPPQTAVTVACFDQEVVPIYQGTASSFGEDAVRAITDRGGLGASDVQQAILWAGEEAKRTGARRVVIVGDGVATAGETDGQKIKLEVEKLRAMKVERIDAIAVGGIRDDAFLRSLVHGVLDRDGTVLDARIGPDGLARRLGEATFSGVPIEVAGATWSWPKTLDGLQVGDEVIVHAEVPASVSVRIDVGGQQFTPDLRTAPRPLVERAWAQAKIQSLVEAPTEDPSTTKTRIVALSTKHRVLSPHTAMLVLETDADYGRYGIDRNANTDILTVDNGRVTIQHASRGDDAAPAVATATSAVPRSTDATTKKDPQTAPTERDEAKQEKELRAPPPAREIPLTKSRPRPVPTPAMPHLSPPAPSASVAARPPPKPSTRTLDNGNPWGWGKTQPPAEGGEAPNRPMESPTGGIRSGELDERGSSSDEAQRVLRTAASQLRACYTRELRTDSTAPADLDLRIEINASGAVQQVQDLNGSVAPTVARCALDIVRALRFPVPTDGQRVLRTTFHFAAEPQGQTPTPAVAKARPAATPYEGRFKVVMDLVARGESGPALDEARRWHKEQPGDVLSLVALGEALEAKGDLRTAARAYGSILELYSSRADSRRFAGERLERLHDPAALRLAIDTYAKAVAQRPDHPASHRLYGFALLKHGEHEKAFEALRAGTTRSYPPGRFLGADRILREDLGLAAAAWSRADPSRSREIRERLHAAGGHEENEPSLRFVLVWETDANDVDFHIYDARGGHAFYSQKELASGGQLYADVTTGYGPECFTIRGGRDHRAYPYTLQANYYSRGPMGYGMGKLELIEHDGKGNLAFDERPYVVISDRAYVDLGTVERTPRVEPLRHASLMK